MLAKDTNDDPDCSLEWGCPVDGEYQVVVDNPLQQHWARPMCGAQAKVRTFERGTDAPLFDFTATVPFKQSETRKFPFRGGVTYVFLIDTTIAPGAAVIQGPPPVREDKR